MKVVIMENVKRLQVEKRVKILSNYYKHVGVYILINLLLIALSSKFTYKMLVSKNFRITNEFGNFEDGIYPIWIIWGIILMADTVRVFIIPKFLNKNWEERKIKEFLNN